LFSNVQNSFFSKGILCFLCLMTVLDNWHFPQTLFPVPRHFPDKKSLLLSYLIFHFFLNLKAIVFIEISTSQNKKLFYIYSSLLFINIIMPPSCKLSPNPENYFNYLVHSVYLALP